MAARARLFFTPNFVANLDSIQLFLAPEGRSAFERLLIRIFDDISPKLSRFPQAGRSFLAHRIGSREAQTLLDRLEGILRKGDDLREFTVDDYVMLYLVRDQRLYFLAIKHHRQLSVDLQTFWP
jgi:ParE toxin of type II toxin-antitoxin system, parDE